MELLILNKWTLFCPNRCPHYLIYLYLQEKMPARKPISPGTADWSQTHITKLNSDKNLWNTWLFLLDRVWYWQLHLSISVFTNLMNYIYSRHNLLLKPRIREDFQYYYDKGFASALYSIECNYAPIKSQISLPMYIYKSWR